MEYGYTLIYQIKIYNSDPICSIDLNDELLLFGTMLGYCGYYTLKSEQKLIIISEIEDEHITGTIIKKNKLYISVGDEKIIVITKKNNSFNDTNITELNNYEDDNAHYKICEKVFTMMKGNLIFQIQLNIPKEEQSSAKIDDCYWKTKNINNSITSNGIIRISNYWAPFDFSGKYLIFLEFLGEHKRTFDIFSCYDKKFIKQINLSEIKENIGHISHAKILKDEKIFMVHSYKICQIRDFEFKLIKEFVHHGNEIIAIDVYYKNKTDKNYEIAILDLNCDVYKYNSKDDAEVYMLNLHKLSCISTQIKDQKFFSIGWPYFIKIFKNLVAITTDQGCFILKQS